MPSDLSIPVTIRGSHAYSFDVNTNRSIDRLEANDHVSVFEYAPGYGTDRVVQKRAGELGDGDRVQATIHQADGNTRDVFVSVGRSPFLLDR